MFETLLTGTLSLNCIKISLSLSLSKKKICFSAGTKLHVYEISHYNLNDQRGLR